jgi:hypothetical protein
MKIKHIAPIAITLALTVYLSGCATTAKYQTMVDSWKGKNEKELIKTWGFPSNIMKLPEDQNIYTYEHKSSGYYIEPCNENDCVPSTFLTSCTTWFDINKDNIITEVKFRGPDCVYDK